MTTLTASKKTTPFRLAAILFGLCLLVCRHARAADLTSGYAWKQMKIGGGGWVVGMHISPTERGLIYARTDVSGAYRWNAATSSWKQLVTASSMPADFVAYDKYPGVESLVSAPKDPGIAYMALPGQSYGIAPGQIFKSTDRGDHWTATGFASHQVKMEPNGEGRQEGERLAVDPNNSEVVYFGSIQDGLWNTQDGGVTWTRIANVPAGRVVHGVNTVVFDPGAGVLKSKANVTKTRALYVTVDGEGVFQSTDGGETWAAITATAGPGKNTKPRDAALGPDRTYYVACDNEKDAVGAVWKRSPAGAWTNITPPGKEGGSQSYVAVAVDPANARHLIAMCNGGKCFVSQDQGATWTFHSFHLHGDGIQWVDTQANYWLSVGQLAFDPFEPGKLWFAEGFGMWWATDLTTPEIAWHAASNGIEETCGNDVIAPPGGKPVAAMWDMGGFYFSDVDTYTAERSQPGFMSAWALDWCAADPKFVAGVFRNHLGFGPHPNSSGYSTDGGRTWTRFAAVEKGTAPKELEYGVIAVSARSTDKIVWCPSDGKTPSYTKDRGATWQPCDFGGKVETGIHFYATSQKPLCADRVLADTFYFYSPPGGVYRSQDGGATFTQVGNPQGNRWNSFLKAMPGHGGDLWFAGGTGGGLAHSTDGGATWTPVAGLAEAYNVGFGKAQQEGGYPTIFAAGVVAGQPGVYRSVDEGKTWDKVCGYPLGIYGGIDAVDGDKSVFGKVYVCFAGAGFAYGAPVGK